jgi:dsDNA-specific endonuclease/ATPase MutS2
MDDQDFRKLIEQLHSEIEHTPAVDEKGLELLRHIEKDLRELVERSEDRLEKPRPLSLEKLQDAINHLEVDHPALTTTLSELLDILSKAGI